MAIQWFPGHMTKALRMMEENVKLVDSIVYLLDSRAVSASINPAFDRFLATKTVLYVLNKSDLADETATKQWLQKFQREGKFAVSVNGGDRSSVNAVRTKLKAINAPIFEKYAKKGVNKTVRAMVIGVPNSGKSTVINSLCGIKRAVTGDKAGVTKGKQWVRIDSDLELLDTPGTLCPAFENEAVGLHLAYVGSINDTILDRETLCLRFLDEMMAKYPDKLSDRYSIELSETPLENYERICEKRGFLLKGREPDYTRAAGAVFDDFRKGRLGRISLERPEE